MTSKAGRQGARFGVRRLGVSAVVMALLLAMAGVTPAGAQSTATVRVSNLAEASTSVGVSSGQEYARSFCTGPFAVTLTVGDVKAGS